MTRGITDDAQRSREIAEQSRAKSWQGSSFLRELFLGKLRTDLVPYTPGASDRHEFRTFYSELERFLREEVDPAALDEHGEYPQRMIEGLRELGAFGLKIDRQYGGLGFNHREYVEVMQLVGSYCGNTTALLSAHQSIGVPLTVELFGSPALKARYLPRCAAGAISAFALTEPAVGSDPARLATVARKNEDGESFILDGKKLWCTNGTLAEIIIVMARDPKTHRINCFVVDMDWDGVEVERRSHFMGLRALANGVITFDSVRVPRENLVGEEGDGLRIALATLNTGRLSLPAATAGAAKTALEVCRKWSVARQQWGGPIAKHEAIAHQLAHMASTTYAMDTLAKTLGALADRTDRDIRLEAAAAKEWNTTRGWELTDTALQIRGGRGYETEASLAARGEAPIGIERMLRDSRINRIFEGSSEIMHLFIAREAVDKHLEVAGPLIDPKLPTGQKLKHLPRVIAFYALWYPMQWLPGLLTWARYRNVGAMGAHLRFAERASRRLARSIFHGMVVFGPKLEKKQAFLFRAVDVALELFALTSSVLRASRDRRMFPAGERLAAGFASAARRRIDDRLRDMWRNEDFEHYQLAAQLVRGDFVDLEQGAIGVPYSTQDLEPQSMESFLTTRADAASAPPPDTTAGDEGRVARTDARPHH